MKKHWQQVVYLGILYFLLLGCAGSTLTQPSAPADNTNTADSNALHYYFTSPDKGSSCEFLPDILSAIDSAQSSIDVAMYNINQDDIANALIAAQHRGVIVHMVVDNEKADNSTPQHLSGAGIPIVYDSNQSTMHNKFMVIDDNQVWSGSMNFTSSGCKDDYNNMVQIFDTSLAENYRTEFNEMFEDGEFSKDSPSNTPNPQVQIGNVEVDTYFSPDDGVQAAMIDLIDHAQTSIVFMAYSFTADPLADAMIERAHAGVTVEGVMDTDQIKSNTGSEYDRMRKAGISINRDNIAGQMHNKVIIIDGEIVITGSYNFSGNAEKRNDENVLVIHSREAAKLYLQAYDGIKVK